MVDTMPTTGIRNVSKFELVHVDSVNTLRSGAAHGMVMGKPYWDITMSTATYAITNPIYSAWRAFIDNREGSKNAAYFFDPKRPFPIAYRDTGVAGMVKAGTATTFTGDAEVDFYLDRSELVVIGLPAGFILSRADYISFVENDNASLHRIKANTVANGSGSAVVAVVPPIPTAYTGEAVVKLVRAPVLALIQGNVSDDHDIESGQISFSARSVVQWGGGV